MLINVRVFTIVFALIILIPTMLIADDSYKVISSSQATVTGSLERFRDAGMFFFSLHTDKGQHIFLGGVGNFQDATNDCLVTGHQDEKKVTIAGTLEKHQDGSLSFVEETLQCVTQSAVKETDNTGDVEIVKRGKLGIDESLTVGMAFDKYKFFSQTSWSSLEDEQGRRLVHFVGRFDPKLVCQKYSTLDASFPGLRRFMYENIDRDTDVPKFVNMHIYFTIIDRFVFRPTRIQFEPVGAKNIDGRFQFVDIKLAMEMTIQEIYANELAKFAFAGYISYYDRKHKSRR